MVDPGDNVDNYADNNSTFGFVATMAFWTTLSRRTTLLLSAAVDDEPVAVYAAFSNNDSLCLYCVCLHD